MSNSIIVVKEVIDKKGLKNFISAPHHIYSNDSNWIAPPDFSIRGQLSRKHNPFFEVGEAKLWVAYIDNFPVGRISGQVNHSSLAIHKDGAGHFGFFEAKNKDVFDCLIAVVKEYILNYGLTKLVGPFNFSINQEVGLLVDGFNYEPFIGMTHTLPIYQKWFESEGFLKEKDLIAYLFDFQKPLPESMNKMVRSERADIIIQSSSKKTFSRDMTQIIHVFNDAWKNNWGSLPFSDAEIKYIINEMKIFVDPKFVFFVEIKGKTVGILVAMPNLNEIIAKLKGDFFTKIKLLWFLKTYTIKSYRIFLGGVVHEYREKGIFLALLMKLIETAKSLDIHTGEISWVLEDNKGFNAFMEKMEAVPYKRYRIYRGQ